jgi:uncharacterized membrane protein YhaH (DUF805 family)
MDFKTAVGVCLNKYVDFLGRAGLRDYWFFVLAVVGAAVAASIVDRILGMGPFGLLYLVVLLGSLLPSAAAQVRRLHDTGRSGWWALLALVPIVGIIVLIVWCSEQGSDEANVYGDAPHWDSTVDITTPESQPRPSASKRQSDLERLEKLHALHEKGALTSEEFAAEKARILG